MLGLKQTRNNRNNAQIIYWEDTIIHNNVGNHIVNIKPKGE